MADPIEADPPKARRPLLRWLVGGCLLCWALGACAGPDLHALRDTAPSSSALWVPGEGENPKPPPPKPPHIPEGLEHRPWSLEDVVDLALRNNHRTRAAWADAQAAAAEYGSRLGAYYPAVDLTAGVTARSSSLSGGPPPSGSGAASGADSLVYGPSMGLSWLLFDFGSRSGSAETARQTLFALNWTQNGLLQDSVLAVEQAYYRFMAAKATLAARQTSLGESRLNLEAATARHDAGLATIADVLQARTAVSQAQLAVQTAAGAVHTTRGVLAASMGLPANLSFDIEEMPGTVPLEGVSRQVDELIARALETRPSLLSARAEVLASEAQVGRARGDALPYVTLTSSVGRTYFDPLGSGGSGSDSGHSDAFTAGVALNIPLFTGFSRSYNIEKAKAQSRATQEREQTLEQQVIVEVYTAYYELQTATQTVRTADDLVASAQQSEEVALGRYKEGVGTILDLTTAQTALADARTQQILALWGWYTSLAQLAHDTGLLDLKGGTVLQPTASPLRKQSPKEK